MPLVTTGPFAKSSFIYQTLWVSTGCEILSDIQWRLNTQPHISLTLCFSIIYHVSPVLQTPLLLLAHSRWAEHILHLHIFQEHQRIIVLNDEPGSFPVGFVFVFFFSWSTLKHFHRRKVSSAAADTTVSPSGDMAMCSTRAVWPVQRYSTQK